MRRRVFGILEGGDGDAATRAVRGALVVLILANIAAVVAESVPAVGQRHAGLFGAFEMASVLVFSVEYALRVWTAVEDPRYANPVSGRLRYALTPMALVDLLAIVPFYLPHLLMLDTRFVRALRLLRLLRTFKLSRTHSASLQLYGRVLRAKRWDLAMSLIVMLVMLLISSAVMYFVEHEAQPQAYASIPAAMWWGIATLTTIGYGDIYPITALGKTIGGAVAVIGVGFFAVPPAIFVAGLLDELQRKRDVKAVCPHCGKGLDAEAGN